MTDHERRPGALIIHGATPQQVTWCIDGPPLHDTSRWTLLSAHSRITQPHAPATVRVDGEWLDESDVIALHSAIIRAALNADDHDDDSDDGPHEATECRNHRCTNHSEYPTGFCAQCEDVFS